MKAHLLIAAAGISTFASLALPAASGAQSSQISGQVLTATEEQPLVDATITIAGLNVNVRTDSAGRYRIGNIPKGKYLVEVRKIGYKPFSNTIIFDGQHADEADFLLEMFSTTLATMEVRAAFEKRFAFKLAEFESRRKMGFGKFVTHETLERNTHLTLGTLLQNLFGNVRVSTIDGSQVAVSGRGMAACPVQVMLNGFTAYNGESVYFDTSLILVENVIGIEFYTRLMSPLEFVTRPRGNTGGSGCGTLILWTKV